MRTACCSALGVLLGAAAQAPEISGQVFAALEAQSAIQRQVALLIICGSAGQLPEAQLQKINAQLSLGETPFSELSPFLTRLQYEARIIIERAPLTGLKLPAATRPSVFLGALQKVVQGAAGADPQSEVFAHRLNLIDVMRQYTETDTLLRLRLSALAAAAVVTSSASLPDKVSDFVRPLVEAVREDPSESLQAVAARGLAKLMHGCVLRQPCPNEKIVKNLAASLTRRDESTTEISIKVARRGVGALIRALCTLCGTSIFESIPRLWATVSEPLLQTEGEAAALEKLLAESIAMASLMVAPLSSAGLQKLAQQLVAVVPLVMERLLSSHSPSVDVPGPLCTEAAGVVAEMSTRFGVAAMNVIVPCVLGYISNPSSPLHRALGVLVLKRTVQRMGLDVVPYIAVLVPALLSRMSDQNLAVRTNAAECFAMLVKLMPLEPSASDPPGLDPALSKLRSEQRMFLEELLDPSKLSSVAMPVPINAELRSYQRDGVTWLWFLHRYGLHGVLCDDMGLGKTLQTICLLLAAAHEHHQERLRSGDELQASLVIAPPTVVAHWFHEIEKFSPGTHAVMLHGPPSERAAAQARFDQYEASGRRGAPHQASIVIASYEVVRSDLSWFQKRTWLYTVLDEGHIIKNSKAKITLAVKSLPSAHRLLLSGTPIQNNVLELWSLFDFLMPGFLGTESEFAEKYSRPILASKGPKATDKDIERGVQATEALHRQALPFMMRRMKEQVLADLPPKIIQDYYCELSPLQLRLYDAFAQSSEKEGLVALLSSEHASDLVGDMEADGTDGPSQKRAKNISGAATHVFQALQYLRKLINHPQLVLTPQHPLFSQVERELQAQGTPLSSVQHSPKLLALRDLLVELGIGAGSEQVAEKVAGDPTEDKAELATLAGSTGQHRALVFAQSKTMLDLLEKDVLRALLPGAAYLRLDGSVPAHLRQGIVHRFNNDPTVDLLLLTTQVGGLGLNLTGADTVIFLEHDWNPMKDLQAMDRAHRIGQKRVVNVFRLITRNTLEEKIMGLQRFKLNIANSVVNTENASLRTMDTGQLLDLFSHKPAPVETTEKGPEDAQALADRLALEGVAEVGGEKGKLSKVMAELNALWETPAYDQEFNVQSFAASMRSGPAGRVD
eukprot:TRINITY_DN1291_c0_g1_i2.p1 TRINITY_DN1291_c0_g1~~TRINITY_DN1291_c0_g1_i2.p1  ORF type:complete len:1130 (+),score=212.76 TRINITY_DN1291_c0_g1_i2:3557-6946(+)